MPAETLLRLALALGGLAAVFGGFVWGRRFDTRRLAQLTAALGATSAPERAAAAEAIVGLGLDRAAPALLGFVREEADAEVRASIAAAVARRQWEPAGLAGVADLREWAAATLAARGVPVAGFGPALTRLSDMGGPRRSGADRTPVLVTGAGGAAGIAVIRALRARGHAVVAVDADPLAAGFALADDDALVAPAASEQFLADLCEATKRFGADVVICTVAEEMLALAGREEELAEVGAAIWLPPRACVATCLDKLVFAQVLGTAGVRTPPTALPRDAAAIPGPWIVKPRAGRGSRDVYAVDFRSHLRAAVARVEGAIVQTRVTGREFTADVLVERDGSVACVVPRWRLEVKGGISTKGRTFASHAVTGAVAATVKVLGLRAAANVQGFVHDDGGVTVIEANPRLSGGLPLAQAAGADFVGELVRATRGERLRPERLQYTSGVTMRRYFEEIFS